jgi:hypothetical protein
VKVREPSVILSAGKYTGAAVLTRPSCQRGSFKLQSGSEGSLNVAPVLFDSGQGESVDALRTGLDS